MTKHKIHQTKKINAVVVEETGGKFKNAPLWKKALILGVAGVTIAGGGTLAGYTLLQFEGQQALTETEQMVQEYVNEQQTVVSNLESQLETALQEKANLQSAKTELENQVASMENTMVELNNQITELQTNKEQNEETIANLEGQVAQLEQDIATKNGEIANLETQIAEKNATIKTLEGQVTKLENEVAELENQIANGEATQDEQLEAINTLNAEIDKGNKAIEQHKVNVENILNGNPVQNPDIENPDNVTGGTEEAGGNTPAQPEESPEQGEEPTPEVNQAETLIEQYANAGQWNKSTNSIVRDNSAQYFNHNGINYLVVKHEGVVYVINQDAQTILCEQEVGSKSVQLNYAGMQLYVNNTQLVYTF